jgi:hypothetical protein
METKKRKPKLLKLKTMPRDEVCRLAICNSPRLPSFIVDGGVVKQWVGIGWISLNRKPRKGDIELI